MSVLRHAVLAAVLLTALAPVAAAQVIDAGARGPDGAPPGAVPDAGVPEAVPAASSPVPRALPRVRLRGQVVAKGFREPLAGASLTIDAVPAGEADEAGRFDLPVTIGPHRLQIQHPGHEPLDVRLEVTAEAPERVFRLMPRQTGERYETVVTPPDERAPRSSLRGEELTRTPGSFGDPFRVVESLPGVAQVVWPLAIYAIRGANPGNTGFLIDGSRVPALFHFALGPSVIHPFFLEAVDFYPGGYPARHGRYVSGIVSARTATPPTDRVHVSADVRLFDTGGIVVAPWNDGRGSIAVAGRFSYTALLFSQFSESYSVNYWDYQVRADHRLGPGRLTLFSYGSGDVLERKADDDADAELDFHRMELRWDGALLGGRLSAAGQVGRDASATSIKQVVSFPIRVRTLTAAPRLVYERSLASFADLEVGGDAELQRFRPRSGYPGANVQDVSRPRDVIAAGGFLATTLRAGQRLSVAPGLRYELFREQGVTRLEPSPRLTVRVRPAGDVWLKGTAGRFTQMASLPVTVPGFEAFGLADYGVQSSWQGSAGVEAPIGRIGTLDATGFYQRLRVTDLRSMFTTDINRDILEVRDGQSYGLEVMLRRPQRERLYGWLAYTLSWSERVVDGVIAASDWDQRHILNLVAGYRLPRGYSIGARFHYNTGRPYPVFDDRSLWVEYRRLPAFHQLDIRGDKRFFFDKYVLDVYVELVNSTFTREVFDLRSRDGVIEEKGYRIVLPSIGVHAEW